MERMRRDNSDREARQKRQARSDYSSAIDNSPMMAAQRRKLHGLFGGAAQLQAEEVGAKAETGADARVDTRNAPALPQILSRTRMPVQRALPHPSDYSGKAKKEETHPQEWASMVVALNKGYERWKQLGFALSQKKQDHESIKKANIEYQICLIGLKEKAEDWLTSYGDISYWGPESEVGQLRKIAVDLISKTKSEMEMCSALYANMAKITDEYILAEKQAQLGQDFEIVDYEDEWLKEVSGVPLPLPEKFVEEAGLGALRSRIGGMSRILDALRAYHTTIMKEKDQKSTPITDTVVCLYRLIETIQKEETSITDDKEKKAVRSVGVAAERALIVLEPEQMRGRRATKSALRMQDRIYGPVGENRMQKVNRIGWFRATFGENAGDIADRLLEPAEDPPQMSDREDEKNARIHERHGAF